jgi:hypothetical protein
MKKRFGGLPALVIWLGAAVWGLGGPGLSG